MITYIGVNSPFGEIYVGRDEMGICVVDLFNEFEHEFIHEDKLLKQAKSQFKEYFQGNRKIFDLPLSIEGTEFQKMVWSELCRIPYGEVKSYKEIAELIGKPKAIRAVGQANRRNKIPIIIPCHRVIGAKGNLVGFAGTRTDVKEILLAIEKHT